MGVSLQLLWCIISILITSVYTFCLFEGEPAIEQKGTCGEGTKRAVTEESKQKAGRPAHGRCGG